MNSEELKQIPNKRKLTHDSTSSLGSHHTHLSSYFISLSFILCD